MRIICNFYIIFGFNKKKILTSYIDIQKNRYSENEYKCVINLIISFDNFFLLSIYKMGMKIC